MQSDVGMVHECRLRRIYLLRFVPYQQLSGELMQLALEIPQVTDQARRHVWSPLVKWNLRYFRTRMQQRGESQRQPLCLANEQSMRFGGVVSRTNCSVQLV